MNSQLLAQLRPGLSTRCGALLVFDNDPTGIGIELRHCSRRLCRGLPQILLEQHAILVDHEGHHARVAVLRRIGDEGESACHLPVDHIVLRAARRLIALSLQHAEVVAVERRVPLGLLRYILQQVANAASGPSGLAGCPSAVFQYKPFCLPGSLMNFTANCFVFSPS